MPSFTVDHNTNLPKSEAFQKVKKYFEESHGLRKLDNDLKCQFNEASHSGNIKGSKFECDFVITGEQTAKVSLTINIGLLLSPFKGKIQETLKTKMTELLG